MISNNIARFYDDEQTISIAAILIEKIAHNKELSEKELDPDKTELDARTELNALLERLLQTKLTFDDRMDLESEIGALVETVRHNAFLAGWRLARS